LTIRAAFASVQEFREARALPITMISSQFGSSMPADVDAALE
jgi:hypothetical protein